MSDRDEELSEEELEALVADAFARKGELIPITAHEVRAAEEDGIAFEGELPASLRELGGGERRKATREASTEDRQAASERIVSMDDLRKRRTEKSEARPRLSHVASFVAGLAIAAGVALFLRPAGTESPRNDQGASTSPSAVSSAAPAQEKISVPAVHGACNECCAGSACTTAKGELRACASGRTCVDCSETSATSAYRVRIASVTPAKALDGITLASLDLCGRVTGGEWSCIAAYAEPTAKPVPRSLGRLASSADLASGIELELRPHGQKDVLGHWRDSVRLGATALCRGAGALLSNDKGEDVGSVALMFDDPYYVEIARAGDAGSLEALRAKLDFADVTPALVDTTQLGAKRFALVAGPFDGATANRLKWSLVERSQEASTGLGEDYRDAPLPLP